MSCLSCSEGSASAARWDSDMTCSGQEDKSGEARSTLLEGMERSNCAKAQIHRHDVDSSQPLSTVYSTPRGWLQLERLNRKSDPIMVRFLNDLHSSCYSQYYSTQEMFRSHRQSLSLESDNASGSCHSSL
jgi:hypothetical protein